MERMSMRLALVASAALGLSAVAGAADPSRATAGAGGLYPANTSYVGVTIKGLQLGTGAEVNSDGSGVGNLCAVLLGVSALGAEQRIVIDGTVSGGSRTAPGVVVLTGASTVDLGDGTPPTPGVPFTATLSTGAGSAATVGLVLGTTTLPNASLNSGSLTIE